jgi:hypothetical protein
MGTKNLHANFDKTIIWIIILLSFGFVSKLDSQTYLEYNIATGITSQIQFSYISSSNSANTNSNSGILLGNTSSDTSRSFFPLDIVNDPNAFPWRIVVKIGTATGILIDPYHILTAGHVLDFSPYFSNVIISPGYALGDSPYGICRSELLYLLSDFSPGSASDIAIIKLDRPIGALTGWSGYGYNNTDTYFQTNIFFNPSYPGSGIYDGELVYNWKGSLNAVLPDFLYSFRQGISGMSGSPVFGNTGNDKVTYGILTTSGVKFTRITPNKYDGINKIIDKNTPTSLHMVPLYTKIYPEILKSGSTIDSLSFNVLNYSSVTINDENITANIYLSADSIITASDSLIGTYNYVTNFTPKSSFRFSQKVNLPAITKPAGTYWIGVIVSGNNTTENNAVSVYDAAKLTINNTNNIKVCGTITSTQSNDGISGISITGFPYKVTTDCKGYYETMVPEGWSGTVTLAKEGYTISPASNVYNGFTQATVNDYSVSKNIFTVAGYVKSPISQHGISGASVSGLIGQPKTNNDGYYSASIYQGWSGYVTIVKPRWDMKNGSYSYCKINSNKTEQIQAGFTVAGIIYQPNGDPVQNAKLDGFPGTAVYSDENGQYRTFLDSGWVGTVRPIFSGMQFDPVNRTYNNLVTSYYYHDYQEIPPMALNLRVILSGAYVKGTDSMKSVLKQNSQLPAVPNTDYSDVDTKFIYNIKPEDTVSTAFWNGNMNIVDWISIEILDSRKAIIDTVVCLLRNDGRVLSITGDTLIPLNYRVTAGQYFIIIRHRNHIAIMSSISVPIYEYSDLYDFTTGLDKYFGTNAKKLKNGLYGMYAGDANFDGKINAADFDLYETDGNNGASGYRITDFNIDGYVTTSDFDLFAPNKRNLIITKIPKIGTSK